MTYRQRKNEHVTVRCKRQADKQVSMFLAETAKYVETSLKQIESMTSQETTLIEMLCFHPKQTIGTVTRFNSTRSKLILRRWNDDSRKARRTRSQSYSRPPRHKWAKHTSKRGSKSRPPTDQSKHIPLPYLVLKKPPLLLISKSHFPPEEED